MSEDIKVVAGLGNPGVRYRRSRHNAGFMLVDFFKGFVQGPAWKSWRGIGDYCSVRTPDGKSVFLVKPATFMNDSGRMVGDFCRFHRIPPESALICFDDLSLELGRIRIRQKGSSGGQLGMESVIRTFSTQDVPRLRLGIGPKPESMDPKDFVLSGFSKEQWKIFLSGLQTFSQAIALTAEKGVVAAMDRFN